MKSGVYMLNHDTGYKNIRKELVRRYGEEETAEIWADAGRRLEDFCTQYAHLPKKVKTHTEGQMFRMAAVYLAIKEVHPENAMDLLETGVINEGRRVVKLLSVPLRIPGMDRVMLVIFAKMLDASFGEDAGFRSTKHCISTDEVRFDINQCPYCKYLTEIGCPELIHFSCEIDDIIYGNLYPKLIWSRTKTLGRGDECCDFKLTIR